MKETAEEKDDKDADVTDDTQKPSPAGEGGAAQSAVTDEVPTGQDDAEPGEDAAATDATEEDGGEDAAATDHTDVDLTDDTADTSAPDQNPTTVEFHESRIVSGVTVTVKAPAGAFPAGAALSVKRVAEAAIEEVRDDDTNVAVSYTFDIKVIDADTGEALQPADGFNVEVTFALSEAADVHLDTTVYHLTDGLDGLIAEKLETDVDARAQTVTARQPFTSTEWMRLVIDGIRHDPAHRWLQQGQRAWKKNKKGKKAAISASVIGVKARRQVLHHARLLRYYSSNRNVARVSKSGVVRAVGAGTCNIIVMANNGVTARVQAKVREAADK